LLMSPKSLRAIIAMSWIAGAALCVAGIAFLHGAATSNDADAGAQIAQLVRSQTWNFVYVAAVYVCYALFIPVIVVLTIRLHAARPAGSVSAGSLFCLGGAVEMAATLASMGRWAYAIPRGAQGDASAVGLFQTLTTQFLILDFAGVALVYAAGVLYAIMLWRIHRPTSCLLLLSTALLVVGIPASAVASDVGMVLSMLSILVYAAASVCLGYVVRMLGSDATPPRANQDAD
jgi:hypothetical protein